MKQSKALKDMSVHEASDFWDEHGFTEFDDVDEVKDVKFAMEQRKYVGIDVSVYTKIKSKAKKLHKNEDVLINEWLREKVKA